MRRQDPITGVMAPISNGHWFFANANNKHKLSYRFPFSHKLKTNLKFINKKKKKENQVIISANFGWLKLCEFWSSNYKQKKKEKEKEKMGLCKVDHRLGT